MIRTINTATAASRIFVRRESIMDGMGGRIATGGLLAVRGDVAVNVPAGPGVPPGSPSGSARMEAKRPSTDRDPQRTPVLEPALAEIENHLQAAGWDRPPALFALVRAAQFLADDPETGRRLGLEQLAEDALTPIEQDELPDQPLDEILAGIAWPAPVPGCALSQEIVVLPPSAEAGGTAEQAARRAADHPERREARLVVGVLRDGTSAALLRMRAADGGDDDLLTGPDLAPNLVDALLA